MTPPYGYTVPTLYVYVQFRVLEPVLYLEVKRLDLLKPQKGVKKSVPSPLIALEQMSSASSPVK